MDTKSLKGAYLSGKISRRTLNTALASLGLALVPTTFRIPAAGAQDATPPVVFTWGGYEIPEFHREYIEKYGESPDIALYNGDQEAFTKIQAGYSPDLVHPTGIITRQYHDANLIEPIDTARLRYWPDVYDQLKTVPDAQLDGQQYFIPIAFGYLSILYRNDIVEVEEESWKMLWDERYKGRICASDSADGAVVPAALALGIQDPFKMSDAEIERCGEYLRKQRPLVRYYWNNHPDMEQSVATGEVVIAYAWTVSYNRLIKEGYPVSYAFPKEGILLTLDGFMKLKNGEGDEQMIYDFIDAWLSPESGKNMIELYGYGHSNRNAYPLADQTILKQLQMTDVNRTFEESIFFAGVDPHAREKYITMFERVKSGF